jgi:hypothetical protein
MKKRSRIPAASSRSAKSVTRGPGQDRPSVTSGSGEKPWMRHAGKLKHLHKRPSESISELKRSSSRLMGKFGVLTPV